MSWQLVQGTKHYYINHRGQLQSRKQGKIINLKPRIVKKRKEDKGHLRYTYWLTDGTKMRTLAHRLVGIHFIPNPNNYPQLNHIDGDKWNNHKRNLEWGTQSDNVKHSYHVLGHKQFNTYDHSGKNNPAYKAKIRRLTLNKSI